MQAGPRHQTRAQVSGDGASVVRGGALPAGGAALPAHQQPGVCAAGGGGGGEAVLHADPHPGLHTRQPGAGGEVRGARAQAALRDKTDPREQEPPAGGLRPRGLTGHHPLLQGLLYHQVLMISQRGIEVERMSFIRVNFSSLLLNFCLLCSSYRRW